MLGVYLIHNASLVREGERMRAGGREKEIEGVRRERERRRGQGGGGRGIYIDRKRGRDK